MKEEPLPLLCSFWKKQLSYLYPFYIVKQAPLFQCDWLKSLGLRTLLRRREKRLQRSAHDLMRCDRPCVPGVPTSLSCKGTGAKTCLGYMWLTIHTHIYIYIYTILCCFCWSPLNNYIVYTYIWLFFFGFPLINTHRGFRRCSVQVTLVQGLLGPEAQ